LRTPTKLPVVKKSQPSGPILRLNYINAAETDEARRRGRRGRSKGHAICGACTDEDTGSAAAHTHFIIIMHGEREAKTTKMTTQLNRRCLAA
jgi:hypothetical protein